MQTEAADDTLETTDEQRARAVKFVGPDTIEGPAFLFGSPLKDGRDVHGERFAPETDLCIEWFGKSGRPVLYEHGLDRTIKTAVVGRQVEFETRDEGIWAQSQLDLNAKYRKAIDRLIEQEALGYSGGAMAHLATKNARTGFLTRFPWVELSLTPIPANPGNLGVHYVKSATVIEHLEAVDLPLPEPLKAALAALDEWAETRDDDPLAGLKFADHADRLLDGVREFHDRASEVAAMRAKSGRVLSAATRERLANHPGSLRQLADDLDALLADADSEKSDPGKSALHAAIFEALAAESRALGVPLD